MCIWARERMRLLLARVVVVLHQERTDDHSGDGNAAEQTGAKQSNSLGIDKASDEIVSTLLKLIRETMRDCLKTRSVNVLNKTNTKHKTL